jgi:hypothetical protein
MYFVFAMALLLVYPALAGQYESWSAPLAVVFSVPIANCWRSRGRPSALLGDSHDLVRVYPWRCSARGRKWRRRGRAQINRHHRVQRHADLDVSRGTVRAVDFCVVQRFEEWRAAVSVGAFSSPNELIAIAKCFRSCSAVSCPVLP